MLPQILAVEIYSLGMSLISYRVPLPGIPHLGYCQGRPFRLDSLFSVSVQAGAASDPAL
jgi:hypothetical protein